MQFTRLNRTQKQNFVKLHLKRNLVLEEYRTEDAQKDVPKLSRLQFSLTDIENDIVDYLNIFQRIRYERGLFTFKWSEDMIPHILELKDKYNLTDLTIKSKFKSGFSWLLYDYLKARYGYWHKPFPKKHLCDSFVLRIQKLSNEFSLFKKKVLDVSIDEINQYTELNVWYVEEKQGRSIIGFDLHWSTR